jgi:hypothetical protein
VVATEGEGSEATAEDEALPPAVPEEKLSRKFAALAKKEAEILKRERSFKETKEKAETFTKDFALFQSDPVAFLEKHGVSFDKLLDIEEAKLSAPKPKDKTAKELVDEALSEREEQYKAEQAKKSYNDTISSHLNMLDEMVKSDATDFELLNKFHSSNAKDIIWQFQQDHFTSQEELIAKNGFCILDGKRITAPVLMKPKDAALALEEALYETKKAEFELISQSAKFAPKDPAKSEASSASDSSKTVSKSEGRVRKSPSPTMTNAHAATSGDVAKVIHSRSSRITMTQG